MALKICNGRKAGTSYQIHKPLSFVALVAQASCPACFWHDRYEEFYYQRKKKT